MGFRSTLMTEDYGGRDDMPQWFIDKWSKDYHIKGLYIVSKRETKVYKDFAEMDILVDIQQVLKEVDFETELAAVYLHECRGVTALDIWQDRIDAYEPVKFKRTLRVEHCYCYGCKTHLLE